MYWNPFDSAHSGRINSSSGRATILRFILARACGLWDFFFFKAAGGTRVQAVIVIKRDIICDLLRVFNYLLRDNRFFSICVATHKQEGGGFVGHGSLSFGGDGHDGEERCRVLCD
jgi:hypothetical protein